MTGKVSESCCCAEKHDPEPCGAQVKSQDCCELIKAHGSASVPATRASLQHVPAAALTGVELRAEIAEEVEHLGYATPDAEKATHAEVTRKYVERFGDKALVANDQPVQGAVLRDLGAIAAVVGGIGGLIFLAERLRKRSTPSSSTASAKRRKRSRR